MEDNDIWFEGVRESFDIALAEGDYVLCADIIQKVRDEGFDAEAKTLQAELAEEKVLNFHAHE